MSLNRKQVIDAILQKDLRLLRILKYGLPPIKTFHNEYGTDKYYDTSGKPVTKEEIDKDKGLFPPGFISTVIVCYPIGTDIPAYLKTQADEQKTKDRSSTSYTVWPANRPIL
ncbi:hypothetical protein [Adhaeribacter radiodurans]|uniref:Uncharacterized protein n=1 Tax=Adhaeribacter radiodurans TaxID=2745197 RepID=A0A7L7L5R8_9BACT|nr:hypothetical protein [Adhaeribacter radiodurans]QMU28120.1 hypothetical protein HUW48_08700 [Adhaeribacter radiodurans]